MEVCGVRTRWAAKTDRLFQPGAAELQKRHKSVTLLWNSLLSTVGCRCGCDRSVITPYYTFQANSDQCLDICAQESSCTGRQVVTIIATLRWASCGPGTGLQAHPLKSQYRFGKKSLLTNCTKATKNICGKLHLPFLDTLLLQAEPKINWNNYISMVLWACFSNKVCIYQKTNNQNGGCYDHRTHEITLAGSHSLHWGRVQWKIPCLKG